MNRSNPNRDRYGNHRESFDSFGDRERQRYEATAQRRGGTVYYPGRHEDEYPRQQSPQGRGYVSAYSNGYEDGYHAGTRSQGDMRRTAPGAAGSGGRQEWELGYASRQYASRADAGPADYRRDPRDTRDTREDEEAARSQYAGPTLGRAGMRRVGPKNYVRSDDRLREAVCERLAHRDHLDVSEVTVEVQSGVVTLEGHVTDRRMKYEIEDIVDDTFGVSDVVNRLHVRPYGVLASE
ncbi:BON domain-containing protein [Cupriavidus pauculus]|nr:BON domain-containing protein [Cupriavidus pauculus]